MLCIALNAIGQSGPASNSFSTMTGMNTKPELFDQISFGGFDLVSANFKYSKDNTLQKVTLSPFRFTPKSSYLSDIRINLSQKDDISTFGAAFGFDNTNPYNKWSKRVARKFAAMPARAPERDQNPGESDAAYLVYKNQYQRAANQDRVDYFRDLAHGAFSFTIGYNYSAFGILGGTKTKNTDGLIENQYVDKAHSFSADVNYSPSEDIMFNSGISLIRKRKAATEDQRMIRYIGANFSAAYRAFYLQPRDQLLNNPDYVKSFFIPSILVGISYETIRAKGEEKYFENGYKYQHIIMPFLDFKISPTNQFRIGIPIKKYKTVNAHQTGLGPFLQYSLSLANKA